jgi:hypothetical protein
MVVEEKERLAIETGLPSYKEACPNASWIKEAWPRTKHNDPVKQTQWGMDKSPVKRETRRCVGSLQVWGCV